jgi:dienelactone hydrolase
MRRCFELAIELRRVPLERFDVGSPDGPLPGFLLPANARSRGREPAMIFLAGFDVTKEFLYMIMRDTLARRGIACVVVDTPGVGEPLRLRNVASRPDYEVPVGAVVDALERHPRIDPDRIGVMGISLGGYYAPRAAAYEKRLRCCVAWGAILDYGATWQARWAKRSNTVSVPWFQLPWVMGTQTMEDALERVHAWSLVEVLPSLEAPFLIVHGDDDRQISSEDAVRAFDLAASRDKELKIYTRETGGASHCQIDEPDPAREFIADWCRSRLVASARAT